jgi:phage protein D
MSMEIRRQPNSGFFRVSLPTVNLPKGRVDYLALTVHQKIREHDTAVLRIRSVRTNWFKYFSSGIPIRITYWSGRNQDERETFVGYVTRVRLVTTGDDNHYEREILCVAASRVLRKTAQVTYTNKTPAEIVTEIGRKFRLEVVTQQDGLRRETIVQSGETYWQFLNRLSKRTGYVLRVEGTTIYFLPLEKYASRYTSRSPLLSDYPTWTTGRRSDANVIDIDAWSGDVSRDRLADEAVFASVNPINGEVTFQSAKPETLRKKNNPRYRRYLSNGVTAHSAYDAKLLARGAADNGLMAIDASLVVNGNVMLSPYRPVRMNLKDANLSGVWLVKEVTHKIGRTLNVEYVSDVTVSTDSIDGISRRALTRFAPETLDLSRDLINGPAKLPRLFTQETGFVAGSAASSTSVWIAG